MKGKTILERMIGNKFWKVDSKRKNSKGKKFSWARAEAKAASRRFRRQNKLA